MTSKLERKRALVPFPQAGGGRTLREEPREETDSDVLERMAQARGSSLYRYLRQDRDTE